MTQNTNSTSFLFEWLKKNEFLPCPNHELPPHSIVMQLTVIVLSMQRWLIVGGEDGLEGYVKGAGVG